MKLIEYFKKLESIAFGPWLNKYKQLFTVEELETEMFDIIIQAKKNKEGVLRDGEGWVIM
jgi:hypothetical protein